MSAGQRRRLSNPESHAQYLYEARGESSLALNTYNSMGEDGSSTRGNVQTNGNRNKNLYGKNANGNVSNNDRHRPSHEDGDVSWQHNLALLKYLEDSRKDSEQAYLTALKELHSSKDNERDKYRKNKELSLHELVLAYNLALHSFFSQEHREAEKNIFPIFKNISNHEEDFRYIRYGDIKCKIAFLLVDCILAVLEVEIVDEILEWIEKFIASRPDSAVDEASDGISYAKESTVQLKFRLHCYRSRYLFLNATSIAKSTDGSDKEKFDANTRSARKELKNAMEIYHHQLSGKKSSANSIGDGTNGSEEGSLISNGPSNSNNSGNGNGALSSLLSPTNDHRLPFEIKKSEAQNQYVLFLKANLELIKGHTKKSLKLCSETQRDKGDTSMGGSSRSNDNETTHIEHAMYNNNLAIVHQAAEQPYLAMHYYSIALSYLEVVQKESDCSGFGGIKINSDGTMMSVPSVAPIFYNAAMCAKQTGNFLSAFEIMSYFMELSPGSVHHPLPWLHLGQSCVGVYSAKKQGNQRWSHESDFTLSELLSKALSYVTKSITICHRCHHRPSHYSKFLQSARVSLAYIWMELNNPAPVMRLADLVLGEPQPADHSDGTVESQCLRATIRMYACEAMNLMGNPKGALKYLPANDIDSVVEFLPGLNNSDRDHFKAEMMAYFES